MRTMSPLFSLGRLASFLVFTLAFVACLHAASADGVRIVKVREMRFTPAEGSASFVPLHRPFFDEKGELQWLLQDFRSTGVCHAENARDVFRQVWMVNPRIEEIR